MTAILRPAIVLFALLSIITGILYPLAITGIAQEVFPRQANGSIIMRGDRAVGSALIGQDFWSGADPGYFWGRPSATSPVPNTAFNAATATGSGGSNLGPSNPLLGSAVGSRIDALRAADAAAGLARMADRPIPADLVTSSGSGLDPDISPAAAEFQIRRIARARGMDEPAVRALVAAHTSKRQFGVLGEPRVNVLALNEALDEAAPRTTRSRLGAPERP